MYISHFIQLIFQTTLAKTDLIKVAMHSLLMYIDQVC